MTTRARHSSDLITPVTRPDPGDLTRGAARVNLRPAASNTHARVSGLLRAAARRDRPGSLLSARAKSSRHRGDPGPIRAPPQRVSRTGCPPRGVQWMSEDAPTTPRARPTPRAPPSLALAQRAAPAALQRERALPGCSPVQTWLARRRSPYRCAPTVPSACGPRSRRKRGTRRRSASASTRPPCSSCGRNRRTRDCRYRSPRL